MHSKLVSKSINHLGLVSAMFDELGLVELIDSLIKQDLDNRKISIGTSCKALVLNGLGFSQRTLYMVSSFFDDKPVEELLGKGIEASHLNDSVLGRTLDAISEYGTTKLYTQLATQICRKLDLKPKFIHMDSTTFHVDGDYATSEDAIITLKHGYSRDYRPDLKQVVLNMIVENQAGIPIHMQSCSGNVDDKSNFAQSVENFIPELHKLYETNYLVMDSAGYTRSILETCKNKWISRVPATLKEVKELKLSEFKELIPNYTYFTKRVTYAGVEQRWLIIHSQKAYEREIKSYEKRYQKQLIKEEKIINKNLKEVFSCKMDAKKAIDKLNKSLKYSHLENICFQNVLIKKKGRPSKEDVLNPTFNYQVTGEILPILSVYEYEKSQKGVFILATNQLDENELSDSDILRNYKGQVKIERGFRFMKDPQFIASSFFVKKPSRIDALLFIMTLSLSIYASIEHKIRTVLASQNKTISNQVGKPTNKPSCRWVFHVFKGIHFLYGMEKTIILNMNKEQKKILALLGKQFEKYYIIE